MDGRVGGLVDPQRSVPARRHDATKERALGFALVLPPTVGPLVPEAHYTLDVLVLQVEVAGNVRSVGSAVFLRSKDTETGAAGLSEAPVHEASVGFLGHRPGDGVGYRGARGTIAVLGPEEQLGEFLEVVLAGIHVIKVQCSHLLRQPIHPSAWKGCSPKFKCRGSRKSTAASTIMPCMEDAL